MALNLPALLNINGCDQLMSNTTTVKTYAELTEEQLIELHRLAHGIVDDWFFEVDQKEESIHVRSGHLETVFRTQTGNIVSLCGDEITMVRNLWTIVSRCLDWGLDYK
ncbi:hypothetical protein [Spirosoma soli]|uniref:hypothetical protein n=1 Tax=Spirosoma soli TaxID=1770529 RepID=UPI0036D43544